MEIDLPIDELTECLILASTGEKRDTEFKLVERGINSAEAEILKGQGWKFDWSVPSQNGYEVYQLFVCGDNDIQGMIALQHRKSELYTHVDIVEAAPFNVGKYGKYVGVGAHLFAIACKLSWDVGNEGYVQFTAKTDLVEHYKRTLHAIPIDWHNMYIDSYGALQLIRKYFGG